MPLKIGKRVSIRVNDSRIKAGAVCTYSFETMNPQLDFYSFAEAITTVTATTGHCPVWSMRLPLATDGKGASFGTIKASVGGLKGTRQVDVAYGSVPASTESNRPMVWVEGARSGPYLRWRAHKEHSGATLVATTSDNKVFKGAKAAAWHRTPIASVSPNCSPGAVVNVKAGNAKAYRQTGYYCD